MKTNGQKKPLVKFLFESSQHNDCEEQLLLALRYTLPPLSAA